MIGSVATLKLPISLCLEPDPYMTRALGNVSVLRWSDLAGLSWGIWSNHSLEKQRGFPGAAREIDRKTQTGERNVNHERAILADFEDRGRVREPRHVGSVDTGVAGVRVSGSDQLPWTWLSEAHASSPSEPQDKASAVLKPWYLVLCSGSSMGSRCGQGGSGFRHSEEQGPWM